MTMPRSHKQLYDELYPIFLPTKSSLGIEILETLDSAIEAIDELDQNNFESLEGVIVNINSLINSCNLKCENTAYYLSRAKKHLEDSIDSYDYSKAKQASLVLESLATIILKVIDGK
jgi:hypothetical protein